MPEPILKPLVRRVEIQYESDVARMRRVLNERGFDAEPVDIEAAYKAWSKSKTPRDWHSPAYLNDLQLFDALMLGLGEPEPEPEPAIPEANHADPQSEQDGGRTADEVAVPGEPPRAVERTPSDLPRVPDRGPTDRGGRRNGR